MLVVARKGVSESQLSQALQQLETIKVDIQRLKQSVLSGIMEPLMPYLLSFHSQTVFLNFQQMENLLCQSIDWFEAAKNKVNSMN